jgi:hypothetical protein
VDSSLHTVVLLDVKLGKGIVLVGGSVANITKSRGIDNVSHRETLDSLILRDCLRGRGASVCFRIRTKQTIHITKTEKYKQRAGMLAINESTG